MCSMLHTMQSSYQKVRNDFVTSDDAALTSYCSYDRPEDSDCFVAGPEVGGVSIIFIGIGSNNDTFSWELYGWRESAVNGVGPAEFICSGTGILGSAVAEVGHRYADTITVSVPGSWYDVPVAIDSGNNRVCKVCFDLCGFKYLWVRFTDIAGGGIEATSMQAYVGFF